MKSFFLSTVKISNVYYRSIFDRCFFCNTPNTLLICKNCHEGIEENLTGCSRCKLPMPISIEICGDCQIKQPEYNQLIAPYLYQGLVKHLISQFKFKQTRRNAQALSTLLAKKLNDLYSTDGQKNTWPSTLIYVPSHSKRIKERGFCHMNILAKALIIKLESTIELNQTLLSKQTHQLAQHKQSKKQRQNINKSTFKIKGEIPEHIALLDDVITTGATINACIDTLKKAGAKHIDVWSFARTPLKDINQQIR